MMHWGPWGPYFDVLKIEKIEKKFLLVKVMQMQNFNEINPLHKNKKFSIFFTRERESESFFIFLL
jgi:hypothetical protein